MAMLIVDDNIFEAEMARLGLRPSIGKDKDKEESDIKESEQEAPPDIITPDVIAKAAEIVDIKRGRGSIPEVPSPIRQFVAEESLNGTPAKELAESLGLSQSSISAYKNGATSTATYNKPDADLRNHVDKVKSAIATKARNRLIAAIDSLTDDKIEATGAKVASEIARNMSVVIKNLEEQKKEEEKPNQVQFVFFAPKVREESFFPSIEVND